MLFNPSAEQSTMTIWSFKSGALEQRMMIFILILECGTTSIKKISHKGQGQVIQTSWIKHYGKKNIVNVHHSLLTKFQV